VGKKRPEIWIWIGLALLVGLFCWSLLRATCGWAGLC
jgi:hypothetical protein